MILDEIQGQRAKDDYDYAYAYKAYRFAMPSLFVVGFSGGWLCCGIFFGHYVAG